MSDVRRAVFPVMGTMASIVVPVAQPGAELVAADALEAAKSSLEGVDRRFSHYNAGSDIRRWASGKSVSPEACEEIDLILRRCASLQRESCGAFSMWDPQTGRLDTAGYVKGYGIHKAVQAMYGTGLRNFFVSVGGDGFYAGRATPERRWRVAVEHPTAPRTVVHVVELEDEAVATSGERYRGEHIWRRRGQQPLSFTVVGPAIDLADAYATIGFALGPTGSDWVESHSGYRSIVVTAN